MNATLFSEFLIEAQKTQNDSLIVLQKIIDMVDDGYVDYSETSITINVGKLIKDKRFYNLNLIIRKGTSHNVRLAQTNSDGKYVIVVDATRLPAREKIDTFLSKKASVSKFIPEFQKYLEKYHNSDDVGDPDTAYEKGKQVNDRKTFEEKSTELNGLINDKLKEYKKAKAQLEAEIHTTGMPGRKEVLKMSLETLKNEYLGKNSKEFASKMLKLADEDFTAHLDKELKDKLLKRLTDFYEHQSA